jgi:hypothetical protein
MLKFHEFSGKLSENILSSTSSSIIYKNYIEMSEWLGQPGERFLNATENVWKVG